MHAPVGFWTGPGYVTGAYINSDGSIVDTATQTFSLLPSRTGTRRYVVALTWASGTDRELSSATIGGVAATIRGQIKIGDSTRAGIIDAEVPDNGGNNVSVTFAGTLGGNPLCWLSVYDVGDALYRERDLDNADSNAVAFSLAVLKGDFVIGCACAFRLLTAGAFTWTGLSEDSDVELRRNRCTAASLLATSDTTLSATATSSNANECVGAMAVYTPPG